MQTLKELTQQIDEQRPAPAAMPAVHPWSLPFRVVIIRPEKRKTTSTYAYCETEEEAERIAAEQTELAERRAMEQWQRKAMTVLQQAVALKQNFPEATAEDLLRMFPEPPKIEPRKFVAIDAKGLWGVP